MKKNAKGKEFSVSISPSNVYITELNLEDKIRADRLKLAPGIQGGEGRAAAARQAAATVAARGKARR